MIEVRTPDGSVTVQFPDGTPEAVIVEQMRIAQEQAATAARIAADGFKRGRDFGVTGPLAGRRVIESAVTPLNPRGVPTLETLEDAAERAGIGTEGVSARTRFGVNLATGTGQAEIKQVREVLETALGETVEVRIGPDTGVLEFKPESAAGFSLLNTLGPDLGDLTASVPEVGQIATEVAGGLAGAAGGGLTGTPAGVAAGAVTGEALAAYTATLTRLSLAREEGVQLTDSEMHTQALTDAGIAAAGGIAGPLLGSAFRRVTGRNLPRPLAKRADQSARAETGGRLTAGDVEQGQRELVPLQDEIRNQTGRDFPATTGQLTGDNAALTAERVAATVPAGQPVRDVQDAQREAIGDLQDNAFSDRAEPGTRAGTLLRDRAAARSRRAATVANDRVETAENAARSAADDVTRNADPAFVAGSAARNRLVEVKDAVFAPFKARYEAVERDLDVSVDVSRLRREGERVATETKGSIFGSLSQEDRGIIDDALSAGTSERRTAEDGADHALEWAQAREGEPVPLAVVQRDLSNLRDELRRVDKGMSVKNRRVVQRFHDELLKARNEALKDHPDALHTVLQLEADYRVAKQQFDRGVIGAFLRPQEGGGFALPDEAVITRLLRNPTDAREFVEALSSRQVQGGRDVIEHVRRGILGEYQRLVIDPDTGLANGGSHRTFFRNHRPSLRQFFSDQELRRMTDPGEMARQFRLLERRTTAKLAAINRTFGLRLEQLDSGAIMDHVIGSEDDFRRARQVLKGTPALEAFDAELKRRVYNVTTNLDEVSPQAIDRFLQSKLAERARTAFGAAYIENIQTLKKALVFANQKPVRTEADISAIFTQETGLRGLLRFLRVVFPPLSAGGRGMTATVGTAREVTQRAVAEALADPDRLKELLRLRDTRLGTTAALSILGAQGAGALQLLAE